MNPTHRSVALPITAAVLCIALSGCTLLAPRAPQTALRPALSDAVATWPATLQLGRVTSAASLQDTRMIVADGALRMQHPTLRWLDPPPVMLEEELRLLQAGRAAPPASEPPTAEIDIWLASQELRVSETGRLQVAVTASAQLRCIGSARLVDVSADRASFDVDEGPRAVAAGFAKALEVVLASILSQANERSRQCASDPMHDGD